MTDSTAFKHAKALGEQMRQALIERIAQQLDGLLVTVGQKLSDLLEEAAPSRVLQVRQDAWFAFNKAKSAWRDQSVDALQQALRPQHSKSPSAQRGKLELIETAAIEDKIVASRMALAITEDAAVQIKELRKRFVALNQGQELSEADIVHPETQVLAILKAWKGAGMTQEAWDLVAEAVRRYLVQKLPAIYDQCNDDLQAQGVSPMAEPLLKVRNPQPAAPPAPAAASAKPGGMPAPGAAPLAQPGGAGVKFPGRMQRAQQLLQQVGQMVFGAPLSAEQQVQLTQAMPDWPAGAATGAGAQAAATFYQPASAGLISASYQPIGAAAAYDPSATGSMVYQASPQLVQQIAMDLRQQTAELKRQAGSDNEKAIVELVSLMFQAILQEERILAGIRVWFARLQMPVLRLALEDAGFFYDVKHPARALIDQMGSCVMGFSASDITAQALEAEIRRIVQVIEQYPETGRRVYEKTVEEFQTFLREHLQGNTANQELLTMAEQLELKETLGIQYTIELRNQLQDMPVRDEIRDFLLKTWSEVLAVVTVRQGAQHAETLTLKKTASELIWAASAKPTRAERAHVIASLPQILKNLRGGMALLNADEAVQDELFQSINNALADAFMAKTQGIDDARIAALAQRLEHLEDFVSADGLDEFQIDAQAIEQLLGIEVAGMHVINEGGDSPSAEMSQWVAQVGLGSWYRLSYGGQDLQVQHVWRSPLGHLHLLATTVSESYLMQTQRMAAYLEAGLMEPQETESLTTRATRDAMAKLQAQPDLLLL